MSYEQNYVSLFTEKSAEAREHMRVLTRSGDVVSLLGYAKTLERPICERRIRVAMSYAQENLAVADYLAGARAINSTINQEKLFSLAATCIFSGKLLGLKALQEYGFKISVEQQHTAISQKLLNATGVRGTNPNLLRQKYGYLSEWINIISQGRGWQNSEELEYAREILREAKDK